jgi:hypothetical protein
VLGVKLSRVQGIDIPLTVTGIAVAQGAAGRHGLLAAVAKGSVEESLESKAKKKLKKVLGF